MALFARHLIFSAVCLFGLAGATRALAAEPAEPAFRTLAVGKLSAVSGLHYEHAGKDVALAVNNIGLSPAYPAPRGGVLSLYRILPPAAPGEGPRKVPVAEARLEGSSQYLLVLSALSDPGSPGPVQVAALAVDDSWAAHPAESVRVFNFSRRRAAIQVSTPTDTVVLATGESHVAPFPKKGRIVDLKIATQDQGGWVLRFNCPQGIIPKTRTLVVIHDVQPTKEEPNPDDISINTIYDTTPPAKPEPADS